MDTFILERKNYSLANFREFSNNWTTLLMMSLGRQFLGIDLGTYLLVCCGKAKRNLFRNGRNDKNAF